ncbi:haloacid dehalogenase-like hydrolase [Treponema socranskii subsp. socranskii VPI DR56BR1116 = ATCC 35536]|uniref:Haloacid dehalogenase-like hydrolase n=1 Tax=Treponema socranskii subsp. socranskii VPI DR56BR1116 = ATCC 35536 TaxID=1125725 RepID=U1F949_TRESO|nr:HAD family hydrolase [Treponema socranskii]ERF60587.1 haloacid dehalogenase-like hydrolase [Treponema socranskii subsp. socranskii VPI DR56BR1116 = ATCC 35536]ERK03174.1 haloacid dehalogenase-like hydrolase [Treponema socranskii subsp. socranskii VPI DR56BR1116 = ATCC 35536]
MKICRLPEKIKTIIFDIDSTLYTNGAYVSHQSEVQLRRFAKVRGISEREARTMFDDYRSEWSKTHGGQKISESNTFAALGIPIETCVAWRNELIEPADFLSRDERLLEALQTLKRSYALVCVTNNPVSVGRKTLCALGVEDCIASVIGLDTFGKSKPAREPFEKAAEETGAEIAECLSVGDRYDIDIVLPLAMGMGGIIVDGVSDVYELPNVLNFSCK